MWAFTPQEKRAILFLVLALLVGTGILNYKKHNPEFAPELLSGNYKAAKFKSPALEARIPEPSNSPGVQAGGLGQKELQKKINLNTATLEELESLPQIGPVLAKRIADYRYEKGGFSSSEELIRVKGIGKKTYSRIKDYVTLEE